MKTKQKNQRNYEDCDDDSKYGIRSKHDTVSATGQLWSLQLTDIVDKAEGLLPAIYKVRGFDDATVDQQLHQSIEQISQEGLFDVEAAAKEIIQTVKNNKKIIIYGDFDADGISATTILWEFLYREVSEFLDMPVNVVPYIPSRIDEGYGLSEKSIRKLIDLEGDLVVTVDCGIRDRSLIKKFGQKKQLNAVKEQETNNAIEETTGVSFIITDHHEFPDGLAGDHDYTIVHQAYPEREFACTKICGATVAFLLSVEIRKQLGMPNANITDDTPGLDLVALATVTDIMPLLDMNRPLVKAGLEQIKKARRLGLAELLKVAEVEPQAVSTYHLGYVIGPRINAAGRIGDALDAVRLLSTRSKRQQSNWRRN